MKRILTALRLPSLDPPKCTRATECIVSRLDRAAAAVLWVCWFAINRALWATVSVVLAIERWKRVADEPRSQWVRRTERYGFDFRCGWCGGTTAEGDTPSHTCCGMAMVEWRRRHDPSESL